MDSAVETDVTMELRNFERLQQIENYIKEAEARELLLVYQSVFDRLMLQQHVSGRSFFDLPAIEVNYIFNEILSREEARELVVEPSVFDRLIFKQHVMGYPLFDLQAREVISIFYECISINNLQPKREVESIALKSHGDKLFWLTPDGTVSSCFGWSLTCDIGLQSSDNIFCYFVDPARVFSHTMETKPVNHHFHPFEVFARPFKYLGREILLSTLVTLAYVDPVLGLPITSSCSEGTDEILCVRSIHAQLSCYNPRTKILLWYERVATFDLSIVSWEDAVRLQQQQQQQHARSRSSMGPDDPDNEVVDLLYPVAIFAQDLWRESIFSKILSGLAEPVIENINACKKLSSVTRTSLGPNDKNKIVIKHQDKLFLNELEIQHPAAKLLVLAAKEQHKKFGDGANLVVSIAKQHLEGAKELIRMGLNPSEIINGYRKASNKLGEILEGLVEEGSETMDVRDKDEVILRMKTPVASKQYATMDILCPLIAEACIQVCPENPLNFNVDNVRVAKLLGKNLGCSKTLRGMVLKVDTVVGSIKRIEKAKVLVIAGGVDTTATETKGSVLIQSDEQFENYAKTKEAEVEELIKAVAESGAKVIVSGAALGEMALHLCERYKIMVLKIASQFELDCFCRTTHAVALLKLGTTVDPSYLGYVDSILVEKTHGARVTVTNKQGGVTTVLLGHTSTHIILGEIERDELERAVDDGVNTYKALCMDSRIVPGGGATEIEIARQLKEYSLTETGLDQKAIAKYAESFELIAKTLAENAYIDATDIISTLYEELRSGNVKVGIDLEEGACKDASTIRIWDLYITKYHALEYAADAVCNVLGL